MAYTKQTWLDRVGTFLNRFTKSNETLSSVELVNNPGTITQAGTAFSASRMNYMESGIENAHRIATPLSDLSRVMQINGDGVPTFPDNVAGRTYWQDDWATVDGWGAFNSTLSVSGGSLIITLTALYGSASKSISVASGELITAIVKSSYSGIMQLKGTVGGVTDTVLASVSVVAGIPSRLNVTLPGALTYLYFMHTTAPTGSVLALDTIYIGSGLYDTPVYGKDGQTVWTNHGVVPVNGKRGKALLFQGAHYLESLVSFVGTSGCISFRYARRTTGKYEHVISQNVIESKCGVSIDFTSLDYLNFVYGDGSTARDINLVAGMLADGVHTYSINFTPTTVGPVYRDGVQVFSQVSLAGTIAPYSGVMRVGCSIWSLADALIGQLDDVEYRLTPMTQGDAIRYHNGDDAVDSQQKSETGTPHAIAVFGHDGKLHATAIEADHAATADHATYAGSANSATNAVTAVLLNSTKAPSNAMKRAVSLTTLNYSPFLFPSGPCILSGILVNYTTGVITSVYKVSGDGIEVYTVPENCYLIYTFS